MGRVRFYFDFISPYASFAWRKLPGVCAQAGVQLSLHPVPFGKLLDHWGQLGPAEIPPKRENTWKHSARIAASLGLKFNSPKVHPFYPLHALRLALPEVAGDLQHQVVEALFNAAWCDGQDMSDLNVLHNVLLKSSLPADELIEGALTSQAKEMLAHQTQQAIEDSVFGVPTMVVDEELFWGYDQMIHLVDYLNNQDILDTGAIRGMLERPRGIDRKAKKTV